MSRLVRLGLSPAFKEIIVNASIVAVGVGTAITTYLPNTFFMDHYAGIFQMYKKGFELEVSEDLVKMLSEVSDDIGVPIVKPPTKLFHVIGYDTTHFGSTMSVYGCMIGLPVSFQHESTKDVEKESILINGKAVPWDSVDGEQLLSSLVISDSAKKFAIAYELALADTAKLMVHTTCGPITTLLCLAINNYFCDAFGLPFRTLPIKGAFYGMLIIFGIGVYFLVKDLTTNYYESAANKRVADVSQELARGGIEFYEKLLIRNKALRNLLKDGSSDFNTIGDSLSLFRRKHLPISIKKLDLEKRLLPSENLNI